MPFGFCNRNTGNRKDGVSLSLAEREVYSIETQGGGAEEEFIMRQQQEELRVKRKRGMKS
ncbi:hypothetical protein EYF80_016150 [Liparis tanakae]|uniref:Uncharacterized protein n=1 Tax=Liparis tanakae TaxID=230148 RepID=A0A4Z2I816_9TELE|nr:hypothetical protein EYF80_016150 [Liparis tanakae]